MYKVFIVEDEILVREGIRNNIHWENTRFIFSGEASDGEMALSMIQEIKPDILITDIKMPFMDGLELSRIVKRTMPWMRIIVLSGHDEFEYARESISIGIDEYILKPINSSLLLSTLDKVVERIEEEKKKKIELELMQAHIKSTNVLLTEKFLGELIIGSVTTSAALEKAAKAGADLIAKCYIVLEAMRAMNTTAFLRSGPIPEILSTAEETSYGSSEASTGWCSSSRATRGTRSWKRHMSCLRQSNMKPNAIPPAGLPSA